MYVDKYVLYTERYRTETESSWSVTTGTVYYYKAVVRSVLEYASPVWHTDLTADKTKTLEAVQRRACQIITGGDTGGTYTENCALQGLENLADRRDW